MTKKLLKLAFIIIFTAYYLLFPTSCSRAPERAATEEITIENITDITEEVTFEEEIVIDIIEDQEVPLGSILFSDDEGEDIETTAAAETDLLTTHTQSAVTETTASREPAPTAAFTTVKPTEPTLSEPPTAPPTRPPTEPPTQPPTERPTRPPTEPTIPPPTEPPTQPPTQPPTKPPTEPPTLPPTEPKRLSPNISLSNLDIFTNIYKNYVPLNVTLTSDAYGMQCDIPLLSQNQKNDSASLKAILRSMYDNSGLADRFSDGFELYSIDIYGAVVPGKTYYDAKSLFDDVLADCEIIVADIPGVSGTAFSYFAADSAQNPNNAGKYIILLSQNNATYVRYADRSGDAYAISAMLFSLGHEGSHIFFDCQTEVWAQFAAFKTTGDFFSGSGSTYNLSIVCEWLSEALGTSKAYYTAITGNARYQSESDFGDFEKHFGPGREIPHISYAEFSAMVDYVKNLLNSGVSATSEEMTIVSAACKNVTANNSSAPESRAFLVANGVKFN